MNNIKIYCNGLELNYETFVFSGGEVQVKLNVSNHKFFALREPITLLARLQSSDDFFRLANIKNALETLTDAKINLFIPYLPYSRQDRVCFSGESFSLKVFCQLLNSLNFDKVTTLDAHSDVGPALINRVKNIKQLDVIAQTPANEHLMKQTNLIFVSPDAGANKKTSELAKYFEHQKFIRADKLRDLSNGKILETVVYADDLSGYTVAICDDLCENGGTFIGLAEQLKRKGASKILLFVTHGLFPKGVDHILASGISEILTTNSFKLDYPQNSQLKVFEIETFIK